MKRLLIVSLFFISTSAMALEVKNEHHMQGHPNCCDKPPHITEHPIHPIGGPISIDHVPGWHHRNHIHPLCSCIGIDHIPFDKLRIYQPQD
jgi:hypothetical protein